VWFDVWYVGSCKDHCQPLHHSTVLYISSVTHHKLIAVVCVLQLCSTFFLCKVWCGSSLVPSPFCSSICVGEDPGSDASLHTVTIPTGMSDSNLVLEAVQDLTDSTNSFQEFMKESLSVSDNLNKNAVSSSPVSNAFPHCMQYIVDVGLNTGQDTALYLQNGARVCVIAVEANPELIAAAKRRFSREIENGRLTLISKGIVASGNAHQKLTFWQNLHQSEHSSFEKGQGCRQPASADSELVEEENICRKVEVGTTTCADVVRMIPDYAELQYLKIDIEGHDGLCVDSISQIPVHRRPLYNMSVEAQDLGWATSMHSLGYTKFKIVNQQKFGGGSGPFGEWSQNIIGKQWNDWIPYAEVVEHWPYTVGTYVDQHCFQSGHCWFDWHAKLDRLS
jgi:FkbM family methyltransferase